jgi:hypothetical protein
MIEIPIWLAKLPKNAMINSKELADALNIPVDTLMKRHREGFCDFPKCDKRHNTVLTSNGKPVNTKSMWKAVTARNYIRHLNRLELEKSK